MFHKCNVRDCASSAKSFVIMFDDYEGYITVPSLPEENGVPVKINVILLRFPQANLFLAKIIVLHFTGACFDAIVRPDRVTSERAETSVTESPENKGIRVEGIHTNIPLSPKFIMITGITNTPLSPKFIIRLRCTSWLQNPTCLVRE